MLSNFSSFLAACSSGFDSSIAFSSFDSLIGEVIAIFSRGLVSFCSIISSDSLLSS
jgi:hypothetical protein